MYNDRLYVRQSETQHDGPLHWGAADRYGSTRAKASRCRDSRDLTYKDLSVVKPCSANKVMRNIAEAADDIRLDGLRLANKLVGIELLNQWFELCNVCYVSVQV